MPKDISNGIIESHGLTPEEYQRIVKLLGREPNLTELGIFSVMWSEHCSYKSSRAHLKRLPTDGEAVVQGPGENAGIIDIGDGWCIAFKIESHNHPSFIEPYQGAATGAGGILRDIFTMGARPVAAMNSLRFGPLTDEQGEGFSEEEMRRNRAIVNGVVQGIGGYGNCFGVPTVGGEVVFDRCYSLNPLVNAFALGLVRRDQIFYGKAAGIGNAVIYVGAKTGRDGIHGATMASAEFDEEALSKRPTVQVGDPFCEKLLLESCLEAMRSGAVVGIQDMGAAGLTCSTCEMGARAGTGIEIDLSLVPQREEGMTPYEIMLSESQERMLLVVAHGREREVIEIFQRWDLDAVVIGSVTGDGMLRVRDHGEIVAEIPARALTDEAPVYHRPLAPPQRTKAAMGPEASRAFAKSLAAQAERTEAGYTRMLETLLTSPNGASKEWVYRQYDHTVRTNTVVMPGSDAAVIRVKETRHALAMTLDGNDRYSAIDPRLAAKLIVAEAARNVVCAGGRPLAVTNCLNFASPENPEVMWQLSETIDGMAEACRAFETPVTGGNVSLYNETGESRIHPTPVIGMVGLIDDVKLTTSCGFKSEGEVVILIGETTGDLSASALAERYAGQPSAQLPALDLGRELAVQATVLEAIQNELVKSAHDCSDGGLAVALAESCFSSYGRKAVGAQFEIDSPLDSITELFAESPSRILLSADPEKVDHLLALASANGVPAKILGTTGGDRLQIAVNGSLAIDAHVEELERRWRGTLPAFLDSPAEIATVA